MSFGPIKSAVLPMDEHSWLRAKLFLGSNQKSTKNQSKINQKLTKNQPKSYQNQPKSMKILSRRELGGYFGCQSVPESRLDLENLRPWTPLALQVGNQNRLKIVRRSIPDVTFLSSILWIDFGNLPEPILGGFWIPKWKQNRSDSHSKRDHGTKTRILNLTHKNQWFLMFLGSTGNPKSNKNRLQNDVN